MAGGAGTANAAGQDREKLREQLAAVGSEEGA